MDHSPRVVCVYKTGGDFTREYVRVLAKSVRRYMGVRMTCLSDDPHVAEYCDWVPITNGWQGWWSKLELFQHFSHALYFDLDTIIKGDVLHLLDVEPDSFAMLRGFSGTGRGNSCVMVWRGDYSYIPAQFNTGMIANYSDRKKAWGDQDFINDHLRVMPSYFQDTHIGLIASRKKNTVSERINCSVLCYHGRPRPHSTGWAAI